MMKVPDSIRSRLRFSHITLTAIPLLIIGVILTWSAYSAQQKQVLQLQQELAHRVAVQVGDAINSLASNLLVTARTTNLLDQTQERQEEIFGQLHSEQNEFVELSLLDPSGQEVARYSYLEIVGPEDYRNRSDDLAFLALANGEEAVYYSPVYFSADKNEPFMTIAIPLEELRSGVLAAVLVADISLKEIWDFIAGLPLDENEDIYLIDLEGQVIAHRNPSIVLGSTTYQPPTGEGVALSLVEGERVITGTAPGELGEQAFFTVVAETPLSRVLQLAWRSWSLILALLILTSSAAAVLAFFAANRITRPIQELAVAAERIRQGDLSQEAASSGLRELDTLATAFNSMTSQLRQTLEGLEQRVADRTQALRASAEVSRNLSTILDRDELVAEVARLVQSSFDYYHVNIFLFDETAERLVLVGSMGESGQAQQVGQYRVSREGGLIGRAATTNQAVLVPDVAENSDWLPNEWLPETKAELAVPIARGGQVLGVLDVQHCVAGSLRQEDADLMQSIANQLAVALQNAQSFEQLVVDKLAEVKQKEEAEERLEVHRRSPLGQAELLAEQLMARPAEALAELHRLTQLAGQKAEMAASLSHLPKILANCRPNGLAAEEIRMLSSLAEGYHYLFASQQAPELLPVGLRVLTSRLQQQISQPRAVEWPAATEALTIYQLCQTAVEVNTISQIVQLDLNLELADQVAPDSPLASLVTTLLDFQSVREILVAYEWVSTAQDKLSYLVSAIERLRHLERQARGRLGSADLSIALQIGEIWQAVIAGALGELQTQAKLACRLLTRHTWQSDVISLILNLRNEGRGAALNLRISLLPGPEYTLLEEMAEVAQLAPGDEVQVTLCVRPRLEQNIGQFRARFIVLYDDPRGPGQSEHFADVVQLLSEQTPFQYIPNPYVVGTPLEAGSTLFFGREELLGAVQENLTAGHRNNLVLIGQRRMGKTSFLKQLSNQLGPAYVPVYLDGQVMGLDPGMSNFFMNLATEITFALEDQGIEIELPDPADFESSPAAYFERQFLANSLAAIGERHLIILFDEFEELESAVRRGYLDASIFGFLRHLMQHSSNLTFIFCGTHRLEELAADYWSILFNISLYHRVGNLNQAEALRLIQQPVEGYGMRYDDLALDKMWRVTAGHPYFLQLLCHSLVNQHNKSQRSYVTVGDLNAALDEILSTGEAHFIYLWTESTPEERLALVAMSRMIPLTGSVRVVQVVEYLVERGVTAERRAIADALYHLALRDILKAEEREGHGENVYRWQLGLLGLWVEKYKSLGRVADETAV
jgi:putative methionine-R-sulfoxide reductase with GAF domain